MGYNLIVSVLRAMGDSFTPFLFLVFGTILNIILDVIFIIPLNWGVSGSAWATNISMLLATVGCFIYAFYKYPALRFKKEDFKISRSFIYEHLRMGFPLGFQYSILQIGIIIMQMAVISFDYDPNGILVAGASAQVGYSIANKVGLILMNVYISIGTAMLTFMGQNNGAKDYERIKKGFRIGILIGTICWAVMTVVGLLITINGAYLHIFLKSENINADVIKYGNYYLYLALPCHFILMLLFIARNSLQGLQRPLFPFLAGVGELIARSFICLYLPQLINGGPINSLASGNSYFAVCSADVLAWLVATVILMIPLIRAIFFNKNDPAYQLKKAQKSE